MIGRYGECFLQAGLPGSQLGVGIPAHREAKATEVVICVGRVVPKGDDDGGAGGDIGGLPEAEYSFVIAVDVPAFVDGPTGLSVAIVGVGNAVVVLLEGGLGRLDLEGSGFITQRLHADLEVGENEVAAVGACEAAARHALVAQGFEAHAADCGQIGFRGKGVGVVLGILPAGEDGSVLEDL